MNDTTNTIDPPGAPSLENFIRARWWTIHTSAQLLTGHFPPVKDFDTQLATGGDQALLYFELKNAAWDGALTTIDTENARETRVKPGEVIAFAEGLGISPPTELVNPIRERGDVPDWQAEASRLQVELIRAEQRATDLESNRPATREASVPPALLRMVLGMAMAKYDHNPDATRSGATAKIEKDLGNTKLTGGRDLAVEVTSVRDWLRKAADLNPRKPGAGYAQLMREK
jgi:hypothetical protein